MGDSFGDRMKDYENRFRYLLPKRSYTLCRLDGKAFHTYTRGMKRPFDPTLIDVMNKTAKYLCENVQGGKIAYVQSDEITILLTDFEQINTSAYFNSNIQKITSVMASMAGVFFNHEMRQFSSVDPTKFAFFDCRAWSLSDPFEVENTFIWRQQDAVRNSIQLVSQSLYSHKELHKKNTSMLQEMIWQKGTNWNDFPDGQKRGRVVSRKKMEHDESPEIEGRSEWVIQDAPTFTSDREFLRGIIPKLPSW